MKKIIVKTFNKEIIYKGYSTKKILLGIFFVLVFFFAQGTQAAILPVGDITTCGTLSAAGTYSLTQDITGVTDTCFIIASNSVVITSTSTQHYTVTAVGGNTAYAITATSSVANGGSAYTNSTIQNITFSGFGGGINANGNTSTNGAGGAAGNIVVATSTLGLITSAGGNGGAGGWFIGGAGGTISITSSSISGAVTSAGGIAGPSGGNGGVGKSISITNSTVSGNVSSTGGNGGVSNDNGGAGGAISIITNSTVSGNALSSGGNGGDSGGNGGAGGAISITTGSSVAGNISSLGGNGGSSVYGNGGAGGALTISGTNLDISNKAISALGGVFACGVGCGSNGANGTLTITYSGTITVANVTLSALSDLIVNSINFGVYNGGAFSVLLSPGVINTCGFLYVPGTYTLGSDLTDAGNCLTVIGNNIIIDGGDNGSGGHFTVNGDVFGGGVIAKGNGHNFTLQNITVTGSVSSNGRDIVACTGPGGTGGSIIIATSTVGNITSNGGIGGVDNSSCYGGGSGGSITITTSTTGNINSIGGAGDAAPGGTISITTSTVGDIISNAGYAIVNPAGNGGTTTIATSNTGSTTSNGGSNGNIPGIGGTITITTSTTSNITSNGGDSFHTTGGNGGSILISGTNINLSNETINASGGTGNTWGVIASSTNGVNGTLTLTYQNLTTNISTFFNNIGTLIINSNSYINQGGPTCSNGWFAGAGCAWNGVFNPLPFYFNNAVNTDWNNLGNWWNDVSFTIQASTTPFGYSQVFIAGDVSTGTSATADTITFNGTSSSSIAIAVTQNAIFNNSSSNHGAITSATSTFYENLTSTVGGTITGIVQRIFTANVATVRNFTTEAGHNNWILIAQGVVVDLSNAIYSIATNVFKALAGGYFISNQTISGGVHVTPIIAISSPIAGINTTWAPNINWDTATACLYSYDNFTTTNIVTCSSNGSDIPTPTPLVALTLSLRGTDSNGNIGETSVTYTYDNTVVPAPIPTPASHISSSPRNPFSPPILIPAQEIPTPVILQASPLPENPNIVDANQTVTEPVPNLTPSETIPSTSTVEPQLQTSSNFSIASSNFFGRTSAGLFNAFKTISETLSSYLPIQYSPEKDLPPQVHKILQDVKPVTAVVTPTAVAVGFSQIIFALMQDGFSLARIFTTLLTFLGLRKRRKPWGVVYDSITKEPIDPAYLVVKDQNGNDVTEAVSDMNGRYGFLTTGGTYRIEANKTNYVFPSEKLKGKIEDELYNNLYFGEQFILDPLNPVITKNIPMDPTGFDWNQFIKLKRKDMGFSLADPIMARVANALFILGFISSISIILIVPTILNGLVVSLYIVLGLIQTFGITPKTFGRLIDGQTGEPLAFAIVRVLYSKINQEIGHVVADKFGRYYSLVPKGEYDVRIDKKNLDESYTTVYAGHNLKENDGIINENFKV